MLDIRFSRALKVMLLLALSDADEATAQSSAQLARNLNTNPSLVRKLLVPLVNAGLVVCAKGRAGGARLGRPAETITLAEIYRCAVGDKPLWACSPAGEQDACLVSAHASDYFAALTAEAEEAVLASLGDRTLADSVRELRRLDEQHANNSA
ncbi:Rrf2 family transcriptional regulator [Saccharopolyspora sp. WRP15-2]|uniref:Rrf2 family transcriptional regulator n=1 Tax=Saccharopolyspora oryzae TaxID=2997343 RepID=A0ABT4V3B1_9PSEU|nr:Rrf2 family transcriptional regulator [Saccharopolyspora oryzae]MDA3628462.1 Rrf2 family transcriptional regulator [Saccharopolyspora oryzae]